MVKVIWIVKYLTEALDLCLSCPTNAVLGLRGQAPRTLMIGVPNCGRPDLSPYGCLFSSPDRG
jgi:hypothetical protein